jgi:hypothetical protein
MTNCPLSQMCEALGANFGSMRRPPCSEERRSQACRLSLGTSRIASVWAFESVGATIEAKVASDFRAAIALRHVACEAERAELILGECGQPAASPLSLAGRSDEILRYAQDDQARSTRYQLTIARPWPRTLTTSASPAPRSTRRWCAILPVGPSSPSSATPC